YASEVESIERSYNLSPVIIPVCVCQDSPRCSMFDVNVKMSKSQEFPSLTYNVHQSRMKNGPAKSSTILISMQL
ncbi:MAG: hypothetical protein ACI8RD_003470, partial [Bacillariaceae sp.]